MILLDISDHFNQNKALRFYFSAFSLGLVSIWKIYQTLKKVFNHVSKHRKITEKYSAAHCIFNAIPGIFKCGQTRSSVFDISLQNKSKVVRTFQKNPHRDYIHLACLHEAISSFQVELEGMGSAAPRLLVYKPK